MYKVSVIIPCYNCEEFLQEAVCSVIQQTYLNWECIIVDDGSTDRTGSIGKHLAENSEKISFFQQENKGVSVARNFGISKATGELILPLDADDKISSTYLERAVKVFNDDPNVHLVYGKAVKFGESEGIFFNGYYSFDKLLRYNMIHSSSFFRKLDWEKVGGYDIKLKEGLEDWEFWISVLKENGTVKYLEEISLYYRIRKGSRSYNLTSDKTEELNRYISFKHADAFIDKFGSFHHLLDEKDKFSKKLELIHLSNRHLLKLYLNKLFRLKIFSKGN